MPWFPNNTPRKQLEKNATLQDVMGACRVVLNHAGGFASPNSGPQSLASGGNSFRHFPASGSSDSTS